LCTAARGPCRPSGLHRQLVGETDFGNIGLGGTQCLVGSNQLKRFGWVVLDYIGDRMVLG
jgi:hypothetical protein